VASIRLKQQLISGDVISVAKFLLFEDEDNNVLISDKNNENTVVFKFSFTSAHFVDVL